MSVARYTLRASPATGIGGMYATAQGEGIPVVTAPLNPEFAGQQNWAMLPGDIPQDKYRVCLYDSSNNFSLGWSFLGEMLVPDEPLILSADMSKQVVWFLKKFDAPGGVENAYTLRADVDILGASWYAGTNDRGEVVVKAVPVVPDIPHELIPYWVMERH